MAEPVKLPDNYQMWWLSFFDGNGKPKGVSLVPGASFEEAVQGAWTFKCNPGGPVCGVPIGHHVWAKWPIQPLKYYPNEELVGKLDDVIAKRIREAADKRAIAAQEVKNRDLN